MKDAKEWLDEYSQSGPFDLINDSDEAVAVVRLIQTDAAGKTASPASEPCLKCGSSRVERRYLVAGCEWKPKLMAFENHNSEWVEESRYDDLGYCKKDCIANFCRTCHFRWERDPCS